VTGATPYLGVIVTLAALNPDAAHYTTRVSRSDVFSREPAGSSRERRDSVLYAVFLYIRRSATPSISP